MNAMAREANAPAVGRDEMQSSPIQRAHRDVHAGAHQMALTWDTFAEQYGRVRLGLPPTEMAI